MSIYNDLNDVRLDLSPYEECHLSEMEQQLWERRVRHKLHPRNTLLSKRWIWTAAAFLLLLGATLPLNQISLAQIPFAKGLFEQIIGKGQKVDYSPYKTAIGQTAETAQGRITLNEIMIEGDRLLINATFEPAEGVPYGETNPLIPHIIVNGIEGKWEGTSTAQSHESNGMYSIFGSVHLINLPPTDKMQVKISYNTVKAHEQPWVFNVEVSTLEINRDSITVQLNKTIRLEGYGEVTLKKIIASPASTLIYYDDKTSRPTELVKFKLVSSSKKMIANSQTFVNRFSIGGETSWSRYDPIDLKKISYWLIPVSSRTGDKIGEPIELKRQP